MPRWRCHCCCFSGGCLQGCICWRCMAGIPVVSKPSPRALLPQSVDLDHPKALDFLREDCLHVNDYFRRSGAWRRTPAALLPFPPPALLLPLSSAPSRPSRMYGLLQRCCSHELTDWLSTATGRLHPQPSVLPFRHYVISRLLVSCHSSQAWPRCPPASCSTSR